MRFQRTPARSGLPLVTSGAEMTRAPAIPRLSKLHEHLTATAQPPVREVAAQATAAQISSGMPITAIKCYPTWQGSRNICLVKVECGPELFGWGEAGLSGRELAVAGAIDHFEQFLVGQDGMRVGALWQEMYRSQYFEGGRVLTAAMSAIDIALYDCLGKKLGVPVYQLLGGAHRHHIPCMVSCASDPATVKARADEGWLNIRMAPGDGRPDPKNDPDDRYEPRFSIARSIEQFVACRHAVGPGPTLGTDYHTRLSIAETASLLQKMPPGTLDWYHCATETAKGGDENAVLTCP